MRFRFRCTGLALRPSLRLVRVLRLFLPVRVCLLRLGKKGWSGRRPRCQIRRIERSILRPALLPGLPHVLFLEPAVS